MSRIISVIFTFFLFAFSYAQNKIINDPNAEPRNVKGFHGIKVSTGIHVYLTQSNEESVVVSANEAKYRERIITTVENGILKIYYDNDEWKFWDYSRKRLKVYVSCKVLDQLKASSGSQVDVDGAIKSGSLAMDFSSGAQFRGQVNVSDLNVEQGSGAQADISGSAANLKAGASSGASMDAYDLQADHCTVRASSGGGIKVTVNKEMSASAHSGGYIHYKGSGVITEVNTGSGGSVSKR
jgi:hypothetical protein